MLYAGQLWGCAALKYHILILLFEDCPGPGCSRSNLGYTTSNQIRRESEQNGSIGKEGIPMLVVCNMCLMLTLSFYIINTLHCPIVSIPLLHVVMEKTEDFKAKMY